MELAGVAQRLASPVAGGLALSPRNLRLVDPRRLIRRSKQQRACLLATPGFETALKRSQKLVRVRARIFRLQFRQELGTGSPRLGPEPVQQLRGSLNERIRATTTSLRFEDRPVRRSRGALLPGRSQAGEEQVDRRSRSSRIAGRLHVGKIGQTLLRRPNVAQQRDRIQAGADLLQLGPNCIGGVRVGSQPLMRRRRRAVGFADVCAIALFSDQLERRLKEVHEQAH